MYRYNYPMQASAQVLDLGRRADGSMDAVAAGRWARRLSARARQRRRALIVGLSGTAAAGLALPFTTASPEAASILAVAAMAMLAGQRWALGVIIVAELALVRALLPIALQPPLDHGAVLSWVSLAAMVPGILAMRRGAAALALLAMRRRTSAACRLIHAALLVLALLCGCGPWL